MCAPGVNNPLALRRGARQRRIERQFDGDVGAAARRALYRQRAAQALDDVLRDRQAEAGAAALGGEVGIEHLRQIRRGDAGAAVGDGDPHRFGAAPAGQHHLPAVAVHRVAGAGVIVVNYGSRSSASVAPGPEASAAPADSRQMALTSARDSSNWIGRAKSSTSLTMRLSRTTSSSISVIASWMTSGFTAGWRSECTADLMIISGLRTSCAITVDSRPSAVSRSF